MQGGTGVRRQRGHRRSRRAARDELMAWCEANGIDFLSARRRTTGSFRDEERALQLSHAIAPRSHHRLFGIRFDQHAKRRIVTTARKRIWPAGCPPACRLRCRRV